MERELSNSFWVAYKRSHATAPRLTKFWPAFIDLDAATASTVTICHTHGLTQISTPPLLIDRLLEGDLPLLLAATAQLLFDRFVAVIVMVWALTSPSFPLRFFEFVNELAGIIKVTLFGCMGCLQTDIIQLAFSFLQLRH